MLRFGIRCHFFCDKIKMSDAENREEWEEVIRKSQNGMKQGVTSCFSRYSQEITLNNYNRLFVHP